MILGLPGESRDMMVETARFIASLPVHGLKIHMLYVIEGTALARQYRRLGLLPLDRETYADIVVDVLEQLPRDVVIQRLTGDPPKGLVLVAPDWVRDKGKTLRRIRERLEERDAWQGKQYAGPRTSDLQTRRRFCSGPP
jgi:radical SAM superfamily enzyme